jgi:hypothetical protein
MLVKKHVHIGFQFFAVENKPKLGCLKSKQRGSL